MHVMLTPLLCSPCQAPKKSCTPYRVIRPNHLRRSHRPDSSTEEIVSPRPNHLRRSHMILRRRFLWMVQIAQGVWPDEIQEPTPHVAYRASLATKNRWIYKMSYYRLYRGEGMLLIGSDAGLSRRASRPHPTTICLDQ